MIRSVVLVALCAVAGFFGPPAAARAAQPRTRTVYVSVVDKGGSPVTDMSAAEFESRMCNTKTGGR